MYRLSTGSHLGADRAMRHAWPQPRSTVSLSSQHRSRTETVWHLPAYAIFQYGPKVHHDVVLGVKKAEMECQRPPAVMSVLFMKDLPHALVPGGQGPAAVDEHGALAGICRCPSLLPHCRCCHCRGWDTKVSQLEIKVCGWPVMLYHM